MKFKLKKNSGTYMYKNNFEGNRYFRCPNVKIHW